MLTIREPISLKIERPIGGIRQDMAERMQANYGLMNLAIRKEELLHVTSEPPEIYFAEGESFNILTNINNQNQQEIRLDVINNLMNRIMVAQTENFTYQDTVYISNVLRKLGIRDEKTFMKQVFALQNEHKETRQLLQKYEENQEILQQLLKSEEEQKESVVREREKLTEKEKRYYIHDEIFQRLETGKIYQDMRNFSKSYVHESRQIYPREMQVAEQTKAVQSFQLQNIKNEITGNTTPLYYLHHNRYEYLQEITEEVTQELEEQISAAILLNLSEQSYILRQQQIEENSHYWYSIAGSFFQTGENTWKRYEANLIERKQFSTQMMQVLEEANQVRHQEGDIINTIVEEYHKNVQQWKEVNEIRQNLLQQRNIQEEQKHQINISGGSYHLTQEEFELNFLNAEEGEEGAEEPKLTVEQLQKQLEIYNQRNYENYQKITEIERQQQTVKDRKVNRRKARMDALRALENPGEVLKEYITSERKDPVAESQRKIESQIYELFSEETKEIYRQYLSQNSSTENTFLQHIMEQPEESEIRQEVVQVLERVEQQIVHENGQDTFVEAEADRKEKKERASAVEAIRKQFDTYHSKSEEIYQRISEREGQRIYVREGDLITAQDVLQIMENSRESSTEDSADVKADALREIERNSENRIHELFSEETKEIYRQLLSQNPIMENTFLEHIMVQTQESENDRREAIEKEIKRQQAEKTVVNINIQKEIRNQQVEFIHKVEEKLMDDELLEEIRLQNQKTVKTEQTEETNTQNTRMINQVVWETVNRVQTNRMEDIEEIVQQSVKRQMNHLSEQVYGKLEKKLQTERKRRGYF